MKTKHKLKPNLEIKLNQHKISIPNNVKIRRQMRKYCRLEGGRQKGRNQQTIQSNAIIAETDSSNCSGVSEDKTDENKKQINKNNDENNKLQNNAITTKMMNSKGSQKAITPVIHLLWHCLFRRANVGILICSLNQVLN